MALRCQNQAILSHCTTPFCLASPLLCRLLRASLAVISRPTIEHLSFKNLVSSYCQHHTRLQKMFNDQASDVVSFNSQLSVTKAEATANVQTSEIVYTENDAQTVGVRNAETQTVSPLLKRTEVDYGKLAEFLKKVTPGVLEALDETYGSSAFDDYNPTASEESVAHAQILKKICTMDDLNGKIKISDLSWGAGGGTLAVSHSFLRHETWCDHLSSIMLFNLRKENEFTDVPSKKLETSSCVTTISYHPSDPSIIAAGLFNGDVLVWNLRDDDAVTPVNVCTHDDCVSRIFWRPRTLNDEATLVSASKHGYILIHKLLANFTIVRQYKRFKIIKEHNPAENSRPRSAGGRNERAAEAGLCITDFDFSPEDQSIFVVGTLCGGVYKCSLHRKIPIEGDDTLLDPVIDEYERHEGSVICVKCSPSRNVFLTSGTDKEIRIYNFDTYSSQQTIAVEDTVVGLTWMIGNQDVFAAYGAGSTIRFYDVNDAKPLTNIKLETPDRKGTSCLRVNSKRDMLAVGDVQGNVEVWKLPRQLF